MRASWSLLAACAAIGLPTPAAAFCPTTTCDPESTGSDACRLERGCLVGGIPLSWKQRCVSFSVQRDGSPLRGISSADASRIIGNAFRKWTSPDCGGAPPSLAFSPTEPVTCDRHEYNQDSPNANLWMFRDASWPYEDDGWTLALTTITFDTRTGEIYDADVEINSFANPITLSPSPDTSDLASIVTHESGHVVGLGHSTDPRSTMVESYREGTTGLRVLSADDVAGVCATYPPDRATEACDPEPRHGFSTECAAPEPGCSCRASRTPRGSGALLALLAVVAAAWRRRIT